jgi:hypothetical protein
MTQFLKKRSCLRGCLIVVLILALPVWYFCIHTTPLRVSEKTTYVLGPMTSDGKRIDYFRAMEERYYPPEMKTDDNGYRLIVRACGTHIEKERQQYNPNTQEYDFVKIDPEPFRLQTYEKLGLDPNVEPTMKKIVCAHTFMEQYIKDKPEERQAWSLDGMRRIGKPWTFDDFPMLKDWLEENTAGLDLLGKAVRKPVFRIPYTRENENTPIAESWIMLDEIQMIRRWARALLARANYRLGTGDIDGAIDDIITAHHLARHAGKHGFLVSWLVGIAIEGMARSIGIAGNPEFPPTKEQIERLVNELDALPPRWTFNEVLETERLFCLASYQDLYWGNNPLFYNEPMPDKLYAYMSWSFDINILLERANKVYDVLTGKSETVDGRELDDIIMCPPSWNPLPLLFPRSRSIRFADSQTALSIPAVQATREAERRCKCAENMQRLTLALLLYEKEHGALPAGDWREAVKPYLGKDADECFRCPAHRLPEGYTNYAMIGDVPDAVSSPNQILLAEVFQPQKLGEGDGRFPFVKAAFWRSSEGSRPQDFDGLGSVHPGSITVGYRSGGMSFLSESNTTEEQLRQLLDGTATVRP